MINKKTVFRAEIFSKSNVGTIDQRSEIIEQLEIYKNTDTGMNFSNPGCFRIDKPDLKIGWLFEEINVLLLEAVNFYKQKDNVFSKILIGKDATVSWWANINAPGSRNIFHTHKEDEFSCVYYLQGTDTGDLRFPNPANLLGDCCKTSPFTRDFLFVPTDGDLILFPSWLPHEVEPNLSTRYRINLAFNFKISI